MRDLDDLRADLPEHGPAPDAIEPEIPNDPRVRYVFNKRRWAGRNLMDEAEKRLRDLAREARDGNRQAFDLLIDHYQTRVMKTALYLTRNLTDAEDVAQEVYIKIFRRLPQFKTVRELDGWVYRVTVNAARDTHRRRRIWARVAQSVP